MIPVFADYESFWSQTHSLTKMNPIEYVMHPDTEIICCAIKVGRHGKTVVAFGEDRVREELEAIDWSDKILIAHNNSEFDAMIFAWRFHIQPKMWGCTLAMARPIHGKTIGCSLAKLVEHYGIGVKNNAVLMETRGRHLCDFSPEEIARMNTYNTEDTEQCAELFYKLLPQTPLNELKVIDLTMRMLVEPKFVLDTPLLEQTLLDVRDAKQQALIDVSHIVGIEEEVQALGGLDTAEAVRTILASAPKFTTVLESLGVDIPMKPSPSNPLNSIPALAKSDQGFLDLLDHDDIRVASVVAARLGAKSVQLETRLETFLNVASCVGGVKPVAIRYCGAETTGRWSGVFKMNDQNLPRINRDKEGIIVPKLSNALRLGLRAPKGKKVVVADLSGIELRVNMFLWKVPYAMKLFQESPDKADLYKSLASEVLRVPMEGMQKMQRQAGKAMHLGCIAEGSLVLTDAGLVPIEQVTTCHKVWDGVEWVTHQGPIYKGTQEVIHYDTLTATPDHIVYLRDGSSCQLQDAAKEKANLARTGNGRTAVRMRSYHVDQHYQGQKQQPEDMYAVRDLRNRKTDRPLQHKAWHDQGVPALQPTATNSEVAGSTNNRNEATMHQPRRRVMEKLWRAWDRVSVLLSSRSRVVGAQYTWATQGAGSGPQRKQWPLRSGELALANTARKQPEYSAHEGVVRGDTCIPTEVPPREVCGQHHDESYREIHIRGDSREVGSAITQTKRHVWDILNAGPRNRFTVSGVLVHNCGFGLGSPDKYIAVAKTMAQIDVTPEEAAAHISGYRAKHPEIVQGWRTCHEALNWMGDVQSDEYIDPWGMCKAVNGGIRTPGGMIRYPGLHREAGEKGQEWWYGTGRNRARIYAGKVDENLVQHLARQVIAGNMVDFSKTELGKRYTPAGVYHDELAYVVDEADAQDTLDTLQGIMRTPPVWWPELVVWSEGDIADTYGAAK